MEQPARGMDDIGHVGRRLNAPVSLLASMTDTSAGPSVHCATSDEPRRRDVDHRNRVGKNRPRQHRSMLHRGDQAAEPAHPRRDANPASALARWPRFGRSRTRRPGGARRPPRRSRPSHPRPSVAPAGPRHEPRRDCRKYPTPRPTPLSPRGEAAWLHSSRDRRGQPCDLLAPYPRATHHPAAWSPVRSGMAGSDAALRNPNSDRSTSTRRTIS